MSKKEKKKKEAGEEDLFDLMPNAEAADSASEKKPKKEKKQKKHGGGFDTFLSFLLLVALGVGGYYGYNYTLTTMQENRELKSQMQTLKDTLYTEVSSEIARLFQEEHENLANSPIYKDPLSLLRTSTESVTVVEGDTLNKKYLRELSFTALPLGLQVGDYVSISIVMPDGTEATVIPMAMVEYLRSPAIAIKVSPEENLLINEMIRDCASNELYTIYVCKRYLTGEQIADTAIYSVPLDAYLRVKDDPTYNDLSRVYMPVQRQAFETLLAKCEEKEFSTMARAFILGYKSNLQAQSVLSSDLETRKANSKEEINTEFLKDKSESSTIVVDPIDNGEVSGDPVVITPDDGVRTIDYYLNKE